MEIKNEKSLSQCLLRDHHKISAYLKDIMITYSEYNYISERKIKNLRWEFKRHFYIEEKMVFNLGNLNLHRMPEREYTRLTEELLHQHDEFFRLIDDMIKCKEKNLPVDFDYFIDLTKKHVKFENDKVYGNFNQYLNNQQKEFIFKSIGRDYKLGFYPFAKLREFYGYSFPVKKRSAKSILLPPPM